MPCAESGLPLSGCCEHRCLLQHDPCSIADTRNTPPPHQVPFKQHLLLLPLEFLSAALCTLLPHTPTSHRALAQVLTRQLAIGILLPTALLYCVEAAARRAFVSTAPAPSPSTNGRASCNTAATFVDDHSPSPKPASPPRKIFPDPPVGECPAPEAATSPSPCALPRAQGMASGNLHLETTILSLTNNPAAGRPTQNLQGDLQTALPHSNPFLGSANSKQPISILASTTNCATRVTGNAPARSSLYRSRTGRTRAVCIKVGPTIFLCICIFMYSTQLLQGDIWYASPCCAIADCRAPSTALRSGL
jgi:hypothetical protein